MSLPSTQTDDLSSDLDDLLHLVDTYRYDANRQMDKRRKIELGQFLTPMSVAQLMASMLVCRDPIISLLDPCAGVGSLLAASVAELCRRAQLPKEIHITAYEIDSMLAVYLQDTLGLCEEMCRSAGILFTKEVRQTDFIENILTDTTANLFQSTPLRAINCAILNPPYRKIQTGSKLWKQLQRSGVKTTNLYTGFLDLCMGLLATKGEMVAITPRSFCSGSYFKPFRKSFLHTMSLRHLHLFASREHTFREDEVLQETVILSAMKVALVPETVLVTSTASPDDDCMVTREVSYREVIVPDDPESCIRIVCDEGGQQIAKRMATLRTSLDDLEVNVSTGRVVDFRAEKFLRHLPDEGTVPLIYPIHLATGRVVWPKLDMRKPNAIVADQSHDLLVPNETYVLMRRFSSKEEKRRVVAVLYEPHNLPGTHVGFENHLNYFHHNLRGLDPLLAKGLTAFLNSTFVDMYIRLFNGHTQVNATDLRMMRYPTRTQLEKLGMHLPNGVPSQNTIDVLIEEILFPMPVRIVKEQTITLSPGGQNVLVELIIREFAERFVPGGKLLYLGDTDEKFAYFDEEGLKALGITLEPHGKIPDIILYDEARNWLVLIEAVTSHGPMTPKRIEELKSLFAQSHAGLVFVTAFLDRGALKKELGNISWESEVWVAESPSHLIHFNGERFLGPH
jgi:adenine-specific DNA-methyltransferase